jgi:hypothetical protein
MKAYHVFFALLKAGILIQFILILLNKQSVDSTVYLLTEIVFKTAVGLFIDIYLFHQPIPGLLLEDKIIISFGGALLIFDAWCNDFPILLQKYNISTPFTSEIGLTTEQKKTQSKCSSGVE